MADCTILSPKKMTAPSTELNSNEQVCAEFARITTVALISKFFSKLDEHTPSLLRIFAKRGGAQGQRIRKLLVPLTQCDCINVKWECVLKALFVYLNEDPDNLIKECMVIRCEGCEVGDGPADVGVVLEGVTALEGLGNVANGVALLIGLIYALNLSYPKELRYTFELLQKVFLELDGHKLSTKVQALKTKLFAPH
ncbi:Actin filament-associated protein 1-like 1 [Labeo rohita]|uniref:Actin filament-associated protein 1-like 1 n=1 Tax=Labeo rohita TaxID=84645 RepID=A0ABQ8LAP0_LABRO|nr:Actin filament-associated protein 1-like 1 [Labeo rohita]